jgi:hypothetical protein
MESKVQKNKMLIYWKRSEGGVQKANFDIEKNDERCEIQKPHMKNDKSKEQTTNLAMNTILFSICRWAIVALVRDLGCKDLNIICQAYRLNQQ